MISIGNDIVSLECVDKQRTNQLNFYSKFITETESSLFVQAGISQLPFEWYVWLLWSVKEAAYKYLKRGDSNLVFSPVKFTVISFKVPLKQVVANIRNTFEPDLTCDIFYSGKVMFLDQILFFRSVIIDDTIATIVDSDQYFEKIHWAVQRIDSSGHQQQSQRIRELTISKLLSLYPQNTFAINKAAAGYPVIVQNRRESNIPLSFAHHGYYISYCFKI